MYQLSQHHDEIQNIDINQRNMPTDLTMDGIRQLFTSGPNQQFILQIIKISEDYSQNKTCHLSDGYCYVNCLLTGEARMKNIKGELQIFDVIRIHREDVIILGLERNPSLELCNLNVLGMRLLCSIGEPVAYQTYYHNEFVNLKGSTRVADGQKVQNALCLPELLQNYPHVPTKWILKAKVLRKPEFIHPERPFMIVTLMDERENIIQGVFFGQVALNAHKRLVNGRDYLFNNGQVKTKRNSVTDFEIKFTEQSQIIPIQAMKSVNNSQPKPEVQNIGQVTIQDITNNPAEGKLLTIVGKAYRLRALNKGRCLHILDQNEDTVEIVLWEEIKDEVREGVTYIFENLRIKIFQNMVSLQSVKNKTKVMRAPYQIQNQNSQNGKNFQNKITPTVSKVKEVRQASALMNVSQVIEMNVTQKQYKDVNGFLIIKTHYMDIKNYFKIECPKCHQNQVSINPLMCRKCSHPQPSIRWNVRCLIMDEKDEMKCVMNEDLCEKLFKIGAIEGFKRLIEDPETFKNKMNQISHIQGIFKIKLNPYGGNVFYNILEIYKEDSNVVLKKTYKQLKTAFKKFIIQ